MRIFIPDYSGENVLPPCLESLISTIPENIGITVIDNFSPTPSESLIPSRHKDRIEVIRSEKNLGYAGAILKAWEICTDEYLIVANNDIEFLPGWFEAIINFAEKSKAHAVRAVIENENDTGIDKSTNASLNVLLYLIPGIFKDRTKAVYPSGACFLLRHDPLDLPIVDADYFLYYEDAYIGFLLRSLGKIVLQCPEAKVRHRGSHSVGKFNRSKIAFYREYNRLVTQLLFFDFPTLVKLSPIIFLDSLFKIPECLIRGKPVWATIEAHFHVLGNIGVILEKRKKLRNFDDFDSRRIIPYFTSRILPLNNPFASFVNILSAAWCGLTGIPADREASE
ncbi:MAG: glycosyltransferase [bacterium]